MVLGAQFGYAMSEAREKPPLEDKVKDELNYYVGLLEVAPSCHG